MTILRYAPEYDHFWVGCSCEEVEHHLFPLMEKQDVIEYYRLKESGSFRERSQDHQSVLRELYDVNEVPEVFTIITRDMTARVEENPTYPCCALIPPGTFCECDPVQIQDVKQLRRLCLTHDNGEPFTNQPDKRKLYFDMDGTLVDFESGIRKISQNILAQYDEDKYDDIEEIFSLMDPMPGAIEAARTLNEYYDCHILSTSPWDNPTGCSDKMDWIKKYLGDVFYKKVTLTHHKDFLNDGESLLIDDRKTHGADSFGDRLIVFDSKNPDWKGITEKLVKMAREEGVGIHALI